MAKATKKETEKKRDEALKRALSMPPKPHKATKSGKTKQTKRRTG